MMQIHKIIKYHTGWENQQHLKVVEAINNGDNTTTKFTELCSTG